MTIKKKKENNRKKSLKSQRFFNKVHKVVAQIPYGKVTTYGHIAEFCGDKSSSRIVGWALNGTGDDALPCHRVVNRNGTLTGKLKFGDPEIMEELLRSEGVEFDHAGNVILERYLWIPKKRTSR